MTERLYVLVDIDHTIADSYWRDHMIDVTSWDEYHLASIDDFAFREIVNLVNALRSVYEVVPFTVRPAKWRELTMKWFVREGVQVDHILMRPDDDFRKAPELKLDLVKEFLGEDFAKKIAFIMDDRDDVVAAFKAEGVTCLQVSTIRRRT